MTPGVVNCTRVHSDCGYSRRDVTVPQIESIVNVTPTVLAARVAKSFRNVEVLRGGREKERRELYPRGDRTVLEYRCLENDH